MRVALVFAFALLAAGCGHSVQSSAARIDPDLAGLIPTDTLALIEARLSGPDSLQSARVYRKYLSGQTPVLDEFERTSGMDPRKDISVLLYCSDGKRGVLLSRGQFHPADAEAKLAGRNARRFDYKGYHLMGDDANAAVFLSSKIVLAGSTTMLREILDGGGHGNPPQWLAALVRTIPADSQLWAAFAGRAFARAFPENSNLGNLNRIAGSLETGVVYADLREGLDMAADGTCSTEDGARQIHDALKGLIGMGRLTTPDNRPEMLRLYDSIQVNQSQRVLHIRANISSDLVDSLFEALGRPTSPTGTPK